jgi:hypothetical protein
MAGYLGLLVLVQSYTWLICRTRRLANGTTVGLAGWVWVWLWRWWCCPNQGPQCCC